MIKFTMMMMMMFSHKNWFLW